MDNSEEQARGLALAELHYCCNTLALVATLWLSFTHAALVATLWLSFTNVKVFKATAWLEQVTKDYDRTGQQLPDL